MASSCEQGQSTHWAAIGWPHQMRSASWHRSLLSRTSVAAAASLTLLAAPQAWPQLPTPADAGDQQVVIWRSVRNDFHDKTISTEFVQEVVTKTPTAPLKVPNGSSLSATLQKTLRISATWTPKMYQELVARIAEVNGIKDIDRIPAGAEILVPQVPTVGKKLKPTFAKTWLGQNIKVGFEWTGDALAQTSFTREPAAIAAPQEEIQYFSVPRNQAAAYRLDNLNAQGVSGPILVNLAQELAPSAAKTVLTPTTANLIKSKLATASGSRPVLVIVDDSIPDNAEYAKAKAFVIAASKDIRKTFLLGDSPYFDQVVALSDEMGLESPSTLFPNLKTHASLIKQSLLEFTALDPPPMERVTVIYLPLGATQLGTAPLIWEILYLAQIIKVVRPPMPPLVTTRSDQRNAAADATAKIIESNRAAFKNGVTMPLDSGDLSVTTDSLYLEALGIVLSYYADATRSPYVLSFSWTAQKFTYPTYFDAASYGLKFAAAGNQKKSVPGLNFLDEELEYASRAANSNDFVVVMNSTGTLSTCPSNFFDDTGLTVASLAYPGEATSQYCGSSFSTSRAAWLTAARDAAVGQQLPLPVSMQGKRAWVTAQHNAILGIKQAAQKNVLGRYSLDVEKYLTK